MIDNMDVITIDDDDSYDFGLLHIPFASLNTNQAIDNPYLPAEIRTLI
jgi:hypothetical protein